MKYIAIKDFKRNGIGGQFNIPYGTELEKDGDVLKYNDVIVCIARSFAAHEHFARNDDGNGLERGKLSHAIIDALSSSEDERWQKVSADELAQKYRRSEVADHWLWSDDFFNAPLEDLKYLAELADVQT